MLFKIEYSSKELINNEIEALKECLPKDYQTPLNPTSFMELTPNYFGGLSDLERQQLIHNLELTCSQIKLLFESIL